MSMEENGLWYYQTSEDDMALPSYIRQISRKDEDPYFLDKHGMKLNVSDKLLGKHYNRLAPSYEVRFICDLECPIEESLKIAIEPHIFEEDTAKHLNVYRGYFINLNPFMTKMIVDAILDSPIIKMDVYHYGGFFNRVTKTIDPDSYVIDGMFNGYINDSSATVLKFALSEEKLNKRMSSVFKNVDMDRLMEKLRYVMYRVTSAAVNSIPVSPEDIKNLDEFSHTHELTYDTSKTIYKIVRVDYPGCEKDPLVPVSLEVSDRINQVMSLKNDFREYNIVTVRDDEGGARVVMYKRSPVPFRTKEDTGFDNDELKHILSL